MRASHVANEAVLEALLRGAPLPEITKQSWWHQALAEASRGPVKSIASGIKEAAAKLFRHATPASTSRLWPFITSLALKRKTAATNVVKATFHAQLAKALRRVVPLWEERNPERLLTGGTEKKRARLRGAVLRYAERSATGHRN